MAQQTLANIVSIVKDTWTDTRLTDEFYNEYPILDRLEKASADGVSGIYMIGNKARVPLHSGRSGSTTVLGPGGGSLNPVSSQKVAEADYTIPYNWDQIGIEFGAINQASGGALSVVAALDLELTNKVKDQRKDITRQYLGDGTGQIAKCGTSSSGQAVVTLDPPSNGSYGYAALTRQWLRPDQTIDIGTASNPTAVGSALTISSVTPGPGGSTAPTITLTGNLANATSTSHFVSIAQARSGSTTVESAGLRGIFGSSTAVVGGIDPASNPWWAPATPDTTTTTMSIDLPLKLQKQVFQNGGGFPRYVLTGINQLTNLYSILQNQVRYQGEVQGIGDVQRVVWNGMTIEAAVDVPDNEWYMYDPSALLLVTGNYKTATWISNVMGVNQGLLYNQGKTNFSDSIVYAVGLGARRRNTGTAAIGLTA